MSIATLGRRLTVFEPRALQAITFEPMTEAYRLGTIQAQALRELPFRAIEARSVSLPRELMRMRHTSQNFHLLLTAYYYGLSYELLGKKFGDKWKWSEIKKVGARSQRVMMQLALRLDQNSVQHLYESVPLPGWREAFTGAVSVARVAKAAQSLGFATSYPTPAVDVMHDIDLFCSVTEKVHLAVQVKTHREAGAFVVDTTADGFWKMVHNRFGSRPGIRGDIQHFFAGTQPLAKSAKQRRSRIVPVWAFCTRPDLDCTARIRADISDIAKQITSGSG